MNTYAIVDPLGHFKKFSDYDILNSCGVLPQWVTEPFYEDVNCETALREQYKHPMSAGDSTVDISGVLKYPGDPDQYPLISIKRGEEMFYQYEFAVIAIVQNNGDTFVSRMS